LASLGIVVFQKNAGSAEQTTSILENEKAVEALKRNGSYDSLAKAVTAARYRIEQDGDTFLAENPAHRIEARFTDNGSLELAVAAKSASLRSAWRLKSLGRGDAQKLVGGGRWQFNETRAELRRAEIGLTEYFENRPTGLEQGFILDEKPAGDENLRLILATSGELLAKASEDGQQIVLSDASGAEVLSYEKLKVWDAENKNLTARMTTTDAGEITLEVEDADAAYPLTIDPTFLQKQKLTANDGTSSDYFGTSVAIAGDTAIVGAPGDNSSRGAAYIFVRNGNVWTQQAKLVAADGQSQDSFGGRVAISSNDTVVVSAYQDYVTAPQQGSVYVFVRNGTTWTAQEKLVADDGAEGDFFGGRVAIWGDTIVVGSIYDNIGSKADQGSVYVFVRSGGAWTQQAHLTASDGTKEDWFGYGVVIDGDMILIGAPRDNDFKGSAYIFTRDGNVWTQSTKLLASDGAAQDRFGWNVDLAHTLSGTFAAIGAPTDTIAGVEQGSVYIFSRPQFGTWSQTQKLTAPDGAAENQFGWSVALSSITGSTLIVGANQSEGESGSAYVFRRSGTVWTQTQKLKAFDSAAGDNFGHSVSISGDTFIVGSPSDAVGSNNAQGSVYTFRIGSAAFDFDGDGKTDCAVFRTINWYILHSENNMTYSFQFGQSGDIPMPADYDGDGEADPAGFRPSAGIWRIKNSSGGTTVTTFGVSGDIPAAADYDGDGKADIAVFRPNGVSGAEWWLVKSSNGQTVNFQFGVATDKPVPGDYTGDGRADIAVWRSSTGEWFVLRSEDSTFYSNVFGIAGDLPTPGDYDGDGRFDTAVFRPSDATWYVNRSALGNMTRQFGLSTDKPVPNAFVP